MAKLRIFHEDDQWSVDCYDRATGAFSERCWSFDTFPEAVEAIPAFCAAEVESPSVPVK